MKKVIKTFCAAMMVLFMVSIWGVQGETANYSISPSSSWISGNVSDYDHPNYYTFTIPTTGNVTVTYEGRSIQEGVFSLNSEDMTENYFISRIGGSTDENPKTDKQTYMMSAGTYTVKVRAYSNYYSGDYRVKIEYESAGTNETEPNQTFATAMQLTDGTQIIGALTANDNVDYYKIVLPEDTDIVLTYSSALDNYVVIYNSSMVSMGLGGRKYNTTFVMEQSLEAGTYYVKIYPYYGTQMGIYTLKCEGKQATPMSELSYNISSPVTYTGSELCPAVTVKDGNYTLIQGKDYAVTYKNNINAGTGQIVFGGIGNYRGVVTKTFTISPKSIKYLTFNYTSKATYTGKALEPTATMKDSGKTLVKNTDYKVTYKNNVNAGTGTIVYTGMGNYTGTSEHKFTITPKNISGCTMEITGGKTEYAYTGKNLKPGVSVTNVSSKYYTLTYTNNKNVGIAIIKVTGKGNYQGSKTLSFKINPPKTTITSLKKGKKSFTVKWKKKTTQVSGYQIQYSKNRDFSGAKSKTIKKYKTTSAKIKSLKAKKTYYVRVRTYKTVSGKAYYSEWSGVSSVVTKK